MFNPFKKKEKDYSLDKTSLPSLSESNKMNSPATELNQNKPNFPENSSNLNIKKDNNFNTLNSQFSNSNFSNNSTENSNSNNSEITEKISLLEAKTDLIKSKLENIDSKLNTIYALIVEEVSDETKKKYSVNSMMNDIKENKL